MTNSEKAYHLKYQRNRYARIKLEFVKMLGGMCKKCGSTELLTFDHIDPASKSFELSKEFSKKRIGKLLPELMKCQLLCQNCHIKKTALENSGRVPHNKGSGIHGKMYHSGCRCAECKSGRKKYLEIFKKRKLKISDKEHGRRLYYYGCRCETCRKANNQYSVEYAKNRKLAGVA